MKSLGKMAALAAMAVGLGGGFARGGGGSAPAAMLPPTRRQVQAEGNKADPFRGIASKGRRAAVERAGRMAARMTSRTPRTNRVFKSDARQAAFVKSLADGYSRNVALAAARRVAL